MFKLQQSGPSLQLSTQNLRHTSLVADSESGAVCPLPGTHSIPCWRDQGLNGKPRLSYLLNPTDNGRTVGGSLYPLCTTHSVDQGRPTDSTASCPALSTRPNPLDAMGMYTGRGVWSLLSIQPLVSQLRLPTRG